MKHTKEVTSGVSLQHARSFGRLERWYISFEDITAHQGTKLTARQLSGSTNAVTVQLLHSAHCRHLISYTAGWHHIEMMCVTNVSLNYSLFATKFSCVPSEVYMKLNRAVFFFFSCIFPKRGLKGKRGHRCTSSLLCKNSPCSKVGWWWERWAYVWRFHSNFCLH